LFLFINGKEKMKQNREDMFFCCCSVKQKVKT
jgi:hypothetical protein